MKGALSVRSRRFLILSFVGLLLLLLLQQFLDYSDLNLLSIIKGKTGYSRTKVLFAYPDNSAIIWDQHNKLYQIYGGSPDSIDVKDGTRLVTFTEPVILKSNTDSIEIGQDYAKYAGYLGIWTNTRKFLIDAQGEVQEIRAGHSEPEF
jgi:hypothetical protein